METIVKKLYEAMFLVDSAEAADWDAVIKAIKNILERAEVEIVSIKKWDERKLAYEINGKTRGTYILCYFRADGKRIQDIERNVQLSERVMRVLILSTEGRDKEDIEKPAPVRRAEKHGQKIAQAEAERAEAKKISARKAAKEAEESEQSAEPVAAGASETGQLKQDERKGRKEPGAEDGANLGVKPDKGV